MRYFFIFFAVVASFGALSAQNTSLTLHFKKSMPIPIYLCSESSFLYSSYDTLAVGRQEDSVYSFQFSLHHTRHVFFDYGIFRQTLVIEPGKSYEIRIPEYNAKSDVQRNEIFFNPIHLLPEFIIKSDSLNMMISTFDSIYFVYTAKYSRNAKLKLPLIVTDSIIHFIDSISGSYTNSYYNEYKINALTHFRYIALKPDPVIFVNKYFSKIKVDFYNPSFQRLFKMVFDKPFNCVEFKNVGFSNPLTLDTFDSLSYIVARIYNIQDSVLIQTVTFKGVHDLYFSSNLDYEKLQIWINQLKLSRINIISDNAKMFSHAINATRYGFQFPPVTLVDKTGKRFEFSTLKGKYVYLGIIQLDNYECLKDLRAIQTFHSRFGDKVVFISLINSPLSKDLLSIVNEYNYEWVFLFSEQPNDLIYKLNLHGYPMYYFLGKEHEFLFSPAAAPSEGIEMKLFDYLKARGEQ